MGESTELSSQRYIILDLRYCD